MPENSLKVVIVGGGPVGIITAHALHHAGIDFVVLESRADIFEDTGASLAVTPQNLRVFHQLGLLKTLLALGSPLNHHSEGFSSKRPKFSRSNALSLLQENHGSATLIFHRSQLIKALYDGLPEHAKNRFLSDKKVSNISLTSTGLEVSCADGSFYPGSIVIGSDGAHSKTRSIMRHLALEADPSLASTWDPEQPFTATYRCLWGSFEKASDPGDSYETQGQDRSTVYLTGVDKGWIFLYEKLPRRSKARVTYSEKEIQSFKSSFAHWPLNQKLKVRDVLETCPNLVGMANLEEGIAKNISWNGSIVLVGDAWHKFTPNSGLGFNNGVQDVVSLCNRLHALSASSQLFTSDGILNTKALQNAFDGYHLERIKPLQADYARSARATRLSAWETSNHYILARYILPLERLQKFLINRHISPGIASGLVLDYIPANEALLGKVHWANPLRSKRDQGKQSQ
ncbi:unnamed protein product [Clonostachys byssicola]|uniref:FAD-binding domain-containing protein n=1 Tax=Clonostachys byssicola TaxID=160290 RepID=A0A9N9Y2T3_9HYPO|nr:unnamed protein product [Clonostachys byssicola]